MSPEITKINGKTQLKPLRSMPPIERFTPVTPHLAISPTVSVVMPAMNEAENLPHVFATLPDWIDEVVLVDGHSTDDTVEVARALRPDVRVVLQTRQGQGRRAGRRLRRVHRRHHRDDRRRRLDRRPTRSSAFVGALVAGADFVKGSRFAARRRQRRHDLHPPLGNRVLHLVVNRCSAPASPTSATATTPSGRRHLDALDARLRRLRGRDADEHPGRQGRAEDARGAQLRALPHPRREQPARVPGRLRVLQIILRERVAAPASTAARRPRAAPATDRRAAADRRSAAEAASRARPSSSASTPRTAGTTSWPRSPRSGAALPAARDHPGRRPQPGPADRGSSASYPDVDRGRERRGAGAVRRQEHRRRRGPRRHRRVPRRRRRRRRRLAGGWRSGYADPGRRRGRRPHRCRCGSPGAARAGSPRSSTGWSAAPTAGMPPAGAVRNLLGGNASFRRAGRSTRSAASRPASGARRAQAGRWAARRRSSASGSASASPGAVLLFEPGAVIWHRCPAARATFAYFRTRCYAEGLSKALVTRSVGAEDGLATERGHALGRCRGRLRGRRARGSRGDPAGLGSAGRDRRRARLDDLGLRWRCTSGRCKRRRS